MRARPPAVLAAAALTLAGCQLPSLSDLPAPNAVSGPTYRVTADFADVQNLPQGAKVKLAGAVIGDVTGISTTDYQAHVSMAIRRRDKVPVGSTAEIRFTTPLGEEYVALTPPAEPAGGDLADGAHLPQAQTSSAPTIEDAFAALSTLINGGGLTRVGSIVTELDTALRGNTGPARDLVARLRTLVTDLDDHKADFDRALTNLDSLTRTLDAGRGTIDAALVAFPQTLKVLAAQTGRIRTVVAHVTTLSTVATSLVRRSSSALISDVASARTVLTSLAGVSSTFTPVLAGLTRFGSVLDKSTPGDYIGADAKVTLDFDAPATLPKNYASRGDAGSSTGSGARSAATNASSSRSADGSSVVVPRALTPTGVVTAVLGGGAR